ncbi:MAG: hypothetical protein NC038_03155 [Paludibacter sp.]|nr:hypothetical protein [Bacteroidales bacterium]MCM1069132.1 hypothetical protein [Prevotella sp.]MCM1353571.1 hypothetical protein [Bacteroides sp.]MCM1442732.1 hypothetical protein [Muribaculum sp.]MCM1481632.1 hypothetical protein [Paludibacter sp.]
MEDKLARKLNWLYYGFYVLSCLVATLFWYLITRRQLLAIDPQSVVGNVVQYVVICYVIASVPGCLYAFKRICEKIKCLPDDVKYRAYYKWAVVRICLIGLGIVLGIVAFYILGAYQSMIWCAAIAALGLYFCKPTPRKIQLELTNDIVQ